MAEINGKSIHANIKSSILLINDPSGSLFNSLYGSILFAISDEYRSGLKENAYINRLEAIDNLLLELSIAKLNSTKLNGPHVKSPIDFIGDEDYINLKMLSNMKNLTINILHLQNNSYQLTTIDRDLEYANNHLEDGTIIILHTYDNNIYELVAEKTGSGIYKIDHDINDDLVASILKL